MTGAQPLDCTPRTAVLHVANQAFDTIKRPLALGDWQNLNHLSSPQTERLVQKFISCFIWAAGTETQFTRIL